MRTLWVEALLAGLFLFAACERGPGTPLGAAAEMGDTAQVRRLLALGENPDGLGPRGLAPLHYAARAGQVAVIRVLLDSGADIDLEDAAANSWTPLMHAIHKRRTEAALELLRAGAAIEGRSTNRATPLLMAAGYGEVEIVRELLDRGADPRAGALGGRTALWYAAGGGALADTTDGPALGSCSPDVVRLLIEHDPGLRLEPNAWTHAISWLAATPECVELTRGLQKG